MRLKKRQKEAVIRWIAEGLRSDEINERAADFEPPFNVSRTQVDWYRKTRQVDIAALIAAGEHEALSTGLAKRAERVKKLKELAELLEQDLLGGSLWLPQVKGVGTGPIAQIVDYEDFNKAEIDAYRGVLDDIAKELGDRPQKQEVTGAQGRPLDVIIGWKDRDDDHATPGDTA